MKKLSALFMVLVLLVGCSSTTAQDKNKIETYKTMYLDILNSTGFKSSSIYFTITPSLTQLSESQFRYDLVIDQAKVAMYDIHILLIQDDGSLVVSDQMMPSIGIFEDETYTMIPNQINKEDGFVEGFGLNGVSASRPIRLKMVIMWKDALNVNYKEYLALNLE